MLILSTIILLISNALTHIRELAILFSRSTMYLLFIICLLTLDNFSLTFLSKGISIYSGLFFVKPYIETFAFFIYLITALILILTSYYPRSFFKSVNSQENLAETKTIQNENLEQYKIIEYSLLILFVLNGAILLMASNDLVSIFLCLELQSYGLYLLCAVYRNSELSTEASLTYFLLGGLSSCIILLGQSLLYINSGNTSLDGIFIISNISDTLNYSLENSNFINIYQYYIQISLVVLSVGFLFKISAAPFHFWSPGVYDHIPTIVTTFVAIIAKISILIMFFEIIYFTSSNLLNISWKNSILLSSLLSLVIGSVLGLTQSRIKRLYAYSTISHLGFILLALSVISVESSLAFFFYIIQYSLTNLNAFLILIAIGYSLYVYIKNVKDNSNNEPENAIYEESRNYSPVQYTKELADYYKVNTVLALSLGITLFSFLGVPPLMGFFGKQMILSAALDRGYIFMVLVAILTSVISGVYYLVLIKILFFENTELYTKYSSNGLANASEIKSESVYNKDWYILFNGQAKLTSSLTNTISIITLILSMFMFISKENIGLFLLLSMYQANI